MFERDTVLHLERHGIRDHVKRHFQEGARDTYPRPGAQAITYGRARQGKGGRHKGQVATPTPDDELVVAEDEPLISLEEIVES